MKMSYRGKKPFAIIAEPHNSGTTGYIFVTLVRLSYNVARLMEGWIEKIV